MYIITEYLNKNIKYMSENDSRSINFDNEEHVIRCRNALLTLLADYELDKVTVVQATAIQEVYALLKLLEEK